MAGAHGPDRIALRNYDADDTLQQVVGGYGTSAQRADVIFDYNGDGALGNVQDGESNTTCCGLTGSAGGS